jgi:hypothetical protein
MKLLLRGSRSCFGWLGFWPSPTPKINSSPPCDRKVYTFQTECSLFELPSSQRWEQATLTHLNTLSDDGSRVFVRSTIIKLGSQANHLRVKRILPSISFLEGRLREGCGMRGVTQVLELIPS